jgi:hypothetical protein
MPVKNECPTAKINLTVVNKKTLFFKTLSGDFFGGHCTWQ